MNKTKLVARALLTGLYFDGTAFNAKTPEEALELHPGTTAADFAHAWSGEVAVASCVCFVPYKHTTEQFELVAKAHKATSSRLVKQPLIDEVRACLRACSTNPEHAGNWDELREAVEAAKEPSLAQLITDRSMTPEQAAKWYVRACSKNGQKTFTIRTRYGKYVSRKVNVPHGIAPAWVRIDGTPCAIVWNQGELAQA